jgi:hypothetical protein
MAAGRLPAPNDSTHPCPPGKAARQVAAVGMAGVDIEERPQTSIGDDGITPVGQVLDRPR